MKKFVIISGRVRPVHRVRVIGLDAPALHIFGDSHCVLLSRTPGVIEHYLGPVTMHRVGRDGAALFALDTLQIGTGDALGFIFGEIDVRVHVAKQRDRFRRNPPEIIDALAADYLATLQSVRRLVPSSPVIVFSIVPPAGRKYGFLHNELPRNGSDQERIEWTRRLNDLLKRGAFARGFGFVDQYSPFANKRGLLDLRMSYDATHVTPESINHDVELLCIFFPKSA